MPYDQSSEITKLLAIDPAHIYRNLSPAHLTEHAIQRREAILTERGALRALTGKYTGRSPRDKFLVDSSQTHDAIDWATVNQPLSPENFDALLARLCAHSEGKELFVFDGFAGADPQYRLPIRIITEYAWHGLFAHQLLIRPTPAELAAHTPQFTLIDIPSFQADAARDGVRSPTVIALDFHKGSGLIVGTEYAGEIKKSIFTVLNYLLPQRDVLPMHCSANIGRAGDTALFFGLSGTGKTTLSTTPDRELIGDDEHGWSDHGVFNFEGGCYAKCINLSRADEPDIWDAIQFGTVLENVAIDLTTRKADYTDTAFTVNTRAAYPMEYIPHARIPGVGGHPKTMLLLTADAFGVLPPISRLTRSQAIYHFLSGYTSKLAGTERGVTTPEPNFSACFGAPFWPLAPTRYADMLEEKLRAHSAACYLVNTGWTGGPYGVGKRMNLSLTRRLVEAALTGELADAPTSTDATFGLQVPHAISGIPDRLLDPRQSWPSPSEYDKAAVNLARQFAANFAQFTDISDEVKAAGPTA